MSALDLPEDRLEPVLADYLTRIDHGETPNQEEYLTRYPEIANELRKFFSDLDFVDARIAAEKRASQFAGLGRWFGEEDTGMATSSDEPSIHTDLPHIKGFKLLEELGSGSQGVVYKAEQLGTKRTVALKVIREGAFASQDERRRFESEVELASRLSHPNIVSIYECGRDAGRDYFAMEFVDGEPLDVFLCTCTLDIPATLELFLEICGAVNYAHQHGVIHRDLKPSNVIVDASGQVRILDFGLAKGVPAGSSVAALAITRVGDFAGTWYYASPEQARRDPAFVDVRSDVYALGVILYEMLTDCLPYPVVDESRETIAEQILHTPPTPPSSIRREVDNDLNTIVLHALQKEPERRYQSVAAFSEDIRRYMAGEAIEAKRDSSWYVLRKTLWRYRRRVAVAGIALAALLVFAVTVSILYSQAVAARATTEVRMRVVRNSQTFTANKLDEFNWASNRLAEIAEAHPDLREVRALRKTVYEQPLELFETAVSDMPERIIELIQSRREPGYRDALAWLRGHEGELAEIEELSQTTRFVFGVTRTEHANMAFADLPRGMGEASWVCEALIARALDRHHHADHEGAVASLDAARSIAVDLGDGRTLLHKAKSVGIRKRTYDAVLAILNSAAPQAASVEPYIDWALRDPPLASYRPAMVEERQKLAQLCEEASFGTGPGEPGRLDFAAVFESLFGGAYGSDTSSPELHALTWSMTPAEALDVIDTYIDEIEEWDALPFSSVEQHADQLVKELRRTRTWRMIGPLAPINRRGYQYRQRGSSMRSATVLAAYVYRYRMETGRWPEELSATLPRDAHVALTDPYIGRPFRYKLANGHLLLYSVNVDGQDDGGRSGDWGEPGTDVVFLDLAVDGAPDERIPTQAWHDAPGLR